ncbi:hypothetical protein ADICYQ_1845 [Cyclobacterium qasimii M12-11B]|uniref:Uncharacterized protein n=1 Tax=Cyclobacterium qasimii M12-11B TaxID=641524 RepID=S7WYQ8_9BACT|nr:hypothetical protein ADICYQ_1845 [Cyclobacterium qasimii M12-11B]
MRWENPKQNFIANPKNPTVTLGFPKATAFQYFQYKKNMNLAFKMLN